MPCQDSGGQLKSATSLLTILGPSLTTLRRMGCCFSQKKRERYQALPAFESHRSERVDEDYEILQNDELLLRSGFEVYAVGTDDWFEKVEDIPFKTVFSILELEEGKVYISPRGNYLKRTVGSSFSVIDSTSILAGRHSLAVRLLPLFLCYRC